MRRSRLIAPLLALTLLVSAIAPLTAHAAGNVQQGGICTQDTDCAGNLACLQNGSIKVCSVDTSLDSSGYGKGNGSVAPGGACATQNDCSGNNACINAVCAADNGLAAQGEACTSDNDCAGELACISGKCSVDSSLNPAANSNNAAAATPINTTTDTNFFDIVMAYIMKLFAWLLGIAAITLDNAMYYTVVHMGSFINGLSAVGVAWRILRDLGNIVLLFGFIILGIEVILDLDFYGGGTKLLPTLLIAAVFLNFSLFIAEAVIDTGNLFATEFYTQIHGGVPAGPESYAVTNIANEGISNAVMNQLGFQTIYGGALALNPGGKTNQVFASGNVFLVSFMAILLFMVAAFVFFSLAFVLIARFVFLIFLIIIAPIGFAGLAVPQLQSSAKEWWGQLFAQTITAPAMLLMLYVALAVITDSQFLTGFNTNPAAGSAASNAAQSAWVSWLGNPTQLGNLASALLSFIVAMGLLMAVTMLSKRMGAFGGAAAMKWGSKLSGIGLAASGVGFAGRSTVGWGGHKLAKGIRGTAFGRSFVGRGIASGIENNIAKASFDVRNTGLAKSAAGIGLEMGKGQTGGYKKDLENRVKEYEAAAAAIKGRAPTREEKQSIADAETRRKTAEQEYFAAESKRNELRKGSGGAEAELERLKKEQQADQHWDDKPGNLEKLAKANEDVAKSVTDLATAEAAFKAANTELADAVKGEETTRKSVTAATSQSKNAAQRAYAERLEKGWSILSPAAAEAAPKIRSSVGKSKEQKDIEKLRKILGEATEKEGGGGGDKEKGGTEEKH